MCPYPISNPTIDKNDKVLGFQIKQEYDNNSTNSVFKYIGTIINTMHAHSELTNNVGNKDKHKNIWTININPQQSSLHFSMNTKEKENAIDFGYISTLQYLKGKQYYEKQRELILSQCVKRKQMLHNAMLSFIS